MLSLNVATELHREVGSGFLISEAPPNPKGWPALIGLSGLLSLLAGLAIVNLHNTWCADWRVIVTILGWLMTIGGIIRIVVPQVAIAIGSTIYGGRAPTIVVALIIGASKPWASALRLGEVAAKFAKFTRPLCKPALSPFLFVHGERSRVAEKTIDRLSGHLARLGR